MNEVKSPKKPLIFYYMVAMLLVMLFNFIAMPWLSQYQIQEVDYNTFVSMVEKKEIGKVDIQEQEVADVTFPESVSIRGYKPSVKGNDLQIKRVVEAISRSKQPLICAGGGVWLAGARDELVELAERYSVPNLILYHTEESHGEQRQKLYLEEGRKYFSGNLLVPEDLDVILLHC